jgi:hypothetical protein
MKMRLLSRISLCLAATLAVSSCLDGSFEPTEAAAPAAEMPPIEIPSDSTGAPDALLGSLLQPVGRVVSSLLYPVCAVRPARVDTVTVDGRGGSFQVDYALLQVPRSAMKNGVARTFEMRTPSDRIASVVFTPLDGRGDITFQKPVKVTLGYAHCTGGVLNVRKHIAYTTDANEPRTGLPRLLELLGSSVDNLLTRKVTAETDHFSRYAVAW